MLGILSPPDLVEKDFIKSKGEWLLYDAFKRLLIEENWIVLFDVWQEEHVSQSHGQHDFLVFVPELGILVLEVKGSKIQIHNSGFESLNRRKNSWEKIKDPFKQSLDNCYSLIQDKSFNSMSKKLRKRILITWGVVFPEMASWNFTTEYQEQRLFINQEEVSRIDLSRLKSFIINLLSYEKQVTENSKFDSLNFEEARLMTSAIRTLDYSEYKHVRFLDDSVSKFEELAEKSFQGIELISRLPFLIIEGGAGTGKTWLSVKILKKRLQDGQKCLFITHSKALNDWIHHSLVVDGIESNALFFSDSDLIKTDLRIKDILDFVGDNIINIFIDEAQDVLPKLDIEFWKDCFGDKISNHSWVVSGDPERQARWSDSSKSWYDFVKSSYFQPTCIPLEKNLRNSLNVHKVLSSVHKEPQMSTKPNNILGEDLYKCLYTTRNELFEKVETRLKKLIEEGVHQHRITILTINDELKNSLKNHLSTEFDVRDIYDDNSFLDFDCLTICDVHDFKGLENDHILLCGLKNNPNLILKELYIGVSRAKIGLSLFIRMSDFPFYVELLK